MRPSCLSIPPALLAQLGRALTCLCLLGLSACDEGGGGGPGPSCAQAGPAFRLLLRAPEGPLPADTRVRVTYQGNLHESYGGVRTHDNEDLCCRRHSEIPSHFDSTSCHPDAGVSISSLAGTEAIACDLWSNGAAQVEVSASGYETTVQELEAEVDEACQTIVTSDVVLVLQRGDAGAP